jgi:hypothetical protein
MGACNNHDFAWYLHDCNEAGWKCLRCEYKPGEPPGFSPELDRAMTRSKVMAVLMELHHADFIYVSNGSSGECIEAEVERRCRATGNYDQWSIASFILDVMVPSHAKYWREISEGVLAGQDPRHRCHCGALSNCSSGDKYYCSEHSAEAWK